MRDILTSRHLAAILALLAMTLAMPSLWQGWVADDLIHRNMLRTSTLAVSLRGLFVFISPDRSVQLTDLSTDLGTVPWWTLETVRVSFFRPVAVLTHWLDYQLWPDSGPLMHAQSILWYGGVCAVAALLYRRLMGKAWVAGLAAFLFAVDAVHLGSVAWLANRNALLSIFFGLLTLIAHDRWRRDGWRAGKVWAPLCLSLALLSGETAVTTGAYLLAHAAFLDRGTWRERAGALAPHAAVAGLWGLVYQHLGYGAWGSGFYVDPVREPTRYGAAALERGPILLLSQWVGQVPILYNFLAPPASRVVWLVAILFMLLVGIVLAPLLRGDRVARFWALGMVLSVAPACSIALLSGRLLLFASLGAMGLMAQLAGGLLDRASWLPGRRAWRIPGWMLCLFLMGVHALLAPFLVPVLASSPDAIQAIIAEVTDIGPLPPGQRQDVAIVNAPSPFHFIYLPGQRSLSNQPMPAHIRVLSPGYFPVDLTRLDAHTVVVRPEHGYLTPPGGPAGANRNGLPSFHVIYVYQTLEKFFRGDAFPIALGERIQLTGMLAEITALTDDGRPAEARIRFTMPLEHPAFRWLQWDWKKRTYAAFTPPAVGQTVRIPGALSR